MEEKLRLVFEYERDEQIEMSQEFGIARARLCVTRRLLWPNVLCHAEATLAAVRISPLRRIATLKAATITP